MFPNLKIFKALSSSSGLISSSSSSLSPRKMVVELIGKWKGRSCFKLKEKYKNKTKAHTHWPQPWITAFSRWKWKAITLGPATACERARAGWGVWSSRAAWWKGGHSAPDPHSYGRGRVSRTNPSPASGWQPLKLCRIPQGTLLPLTKGLQPHILTAFWRSCSTATASHCYRGFSTFIFLIVSHVTDRVAYLASRPLKN